MPRISSLQNDSSLSAGDRLLGTDTDGSTKNFTLAQIKEFTNGGATAYKHHQNNASTTWTITHSLNLEDYLPMVNIKLSGGGTFNNIQSLGVVTYITKDQLKIDLADSASGYAYLKA